MPLSLLFAALAALIIMSAFFSSSETALMSLNRYRLKHLARKGDPGANRAQKLLERPDRLIGIILLGNNFVNILASAIATVIAIRILPSDYAIPVATSLLTVVVLIFAEVAPKTLATRKPERLAFPASIALAPLLKLFYPLVFLVNAMANGLLYLLGVRNSESDSIPLSRDELRTIVMEAGPMMTKRHQKMLVSILDLEHVSVDDIMITRQDIIGINLDAPWEETLEQLMTSQYTRVLVYQNEIDDVKGFVHIRRILNRLTQGKLTKEELLKVVREPYFIPAGTPLNTQLINFQREGRRIGIVVDEYGEILGIVTLEDILEEIVGEFTTDPTANMKEIYPQEDGTYLVDGAVSIRELNRSISLDLPTDGPKTLNGLLIEYLENIPQPGVGLILEGHPVEVVQTKNNAVKVVRIHPKYEKPAKKAR